jgi:Family of unknown function (DUF5715)
MDFSPLLNVCSAWSPALSAIAQRRFGYAFLLCGLALMVSAPSFAVTRAATHTKVHHPRRYMVRYAFPKPARGAHYQVTLGRMVPLFPGSHDMLVRENEELDRLQLPRIADEYELLRFEAAQDLVPVAETDALKIAPDLIDSHRYCRPWTRDFLQDFSQAYYEQFHSPIQINSLVRTVEQQHRLRRWNRFAAPEFGDTASTHLTGVTFDMSRRGLTYEQYEWIRNYLLPLQAQGMVDPIEERQPVLHVVVYDKYSGGSSQKSAWSEANEPTEMDPYGGANVSGASSLTGTSASATASASSAGDIQP